MDKCAKCRKFGTKLFLKGDRCITPKCALTRRNYRPGVHGQRPNTRKSEYGFQLLEKQKAKAEYGLRERQFAKTYVRASKSKENTGEELLRLLELRLDNVVYRLGWAVSRREARQLVAHRKILVNNKILNIPSATLKPKDIISPRKIETIKPSKISLPKWLKLEGKERAEVIHEPLRAEIDTDLDEQKILEFYSR